MNRGQVQAGYLVAFVPFRDGRPQDDWVPFATDFAGPSPPPDRADARFRPSGLAVGPSGELYVSDSAVGRVWRITYNPENGHSPGGDG